MAMSIIDNKHFVDIVLFRRKDENSGFIYEKKERNYDEEARARAFRRCVEYGLNNDWQYFLTITLDDDKVNGKSKEYIIKKVLQEFAIIRKRYDSGFRYLLVSELSPKNNRLHFHGLVKFGKTLEQLKQDGEVKYLGFNKRFRNRFYRFERFFRKFGASRLDEIIKYSPAIVYYIAGYLCKRQSDNRQIEKIGKHYFFVSEGLKKASKIILEKTSADNILAGVRCLPATYQNEFLQKFRMTKKQFQELAEGRYILRYDALTGEVFSVEPVLEKTTADNTANG